MSKVKWAVAGIGDIARKRVIPAIQAEPHWQLGCLLHQYATQWAKEINSLQNMTFSDRSRIRARL
jgi:predicted dehydrogenase